MVRLLFINTAEIVRLNLSKNVGRGQPNLVDDVELVRFGYFCFARDPLATFRFKMQTELGLMKSTGGYGPDLEAVIVVHQRLRGGTQDARVSIEHGTFQNKELYDNKNTWIISVLNNNMQAVATEFFPRIDLHSASGNEVSKKVKKLFTGQAKE